MPNHFFSIGFRPFFLGAAWLAVGWMILWLLHLHAGIPQLEMIQTPVWHGHEMLFGFGIAVIAGFLLTAIKNWTGLEPVQRPELIGLFLLWVIARLAFILIDWISLVAISLLDLAFLFWLAIIVGRTLIRAGNRRNYSLILILAGFWCLNLVMHLSFHGWFPGAAYPALEITVWLVCILLVFMGGRVIPFFTDAKLAAGTVRQWPWLNWASSLATLAIIPTYLVAGRTPILAVILLFAAVMTLARLLAWRPWRTVRTPLLWILHLGYLWLPAGFALQAAHLLGADLAWSVGVHALMVGAMSSIILGMMARVALGHTGRPLVVTAPISMSFIAISLAGVSRVSAPLLGLPWLVTVAGLLWILAFLLYIFVYTPILIQPRADHG
ncbi:MAG: NnrS family protein [Gammaproteobacteria bacterium]